jgi:protein MpaA
MAIYTYHHWATSVESRPIALHSNIDIMAGDQAPLLMIGGTHGDEIEGVVLAKALRNWLLTNHQDITRPWILIPNINPDGVAKNQRTNANGVDLNRNYPDTRWSAQCDDPIYYPGKAPLSEPEVKAVVTLIERVQPHLMIHFHSHEPCIVCTGETGLCAAQTLAQASGYEVVPDIGYPSPGSLGEYGWLDLGIAVICIEAQRGMAHEQIWPRFQAGLLALLRNQ